MMSVLLVTTAHLDLYHQFLVHRELILRHEDCLRHLSVHCALQVTTVQILERYMLAAYAEQAITVLAE